VKLAAPRKSFRLRLFRNWVRPGNRVAAKRKVANFRRNKTPEATRENANREYEEDFCRKFQIICAYWKNLVENPGLNLRIGFNNDNANGNYEESNSHVPNTSEQIVPDSMRKMVWLAE